MRKVGVCWRESGGGVGHLIDLEGEMSRQWLKCCDGCDMNVTNMSHATPLIHQKFNSLLFLACTSGYKLKKGEKRQAKKPSPFSEKADILPSTKKLKSVKKADEKSKMSKEKPNGNNVS